jgi:hypothetical protein
MSKRVAYLVVLLAVVVGAVFWWQNRGGGGPAVAVTPIPPGVTTTVNPACGPAGQQLIGPFAGLPGGRPAQVLIHVVSACGQQDAEIEVETAANKWTPVRERLGGVLGPRNDVPHVGSWYVVAVPNGRRIRLSCPQGETPPCSFEVTDITKQANLTFNITGGDNNPGCGGVHGTSRLLNLSDRLVNVTVTFTAVCTNNAGQAQPVKIHFVAVKPPAVAGAPAMPPLPDATVNPAAPPGQTTWTGPLDAGYTIEVSCTGTKGNCTFTVNMKG